MTCLTPWGGNPGVRQVILVSGDLVVRSARMLRVRTLPLWLASALASFVLLASAKDANSMPAAGGSPRSAILVLTVVGLPPGQRPNAEVRGNGFHRLLHSQAVTAKVRPGRYTLQVRPTTVRRGWRSVKSGA